MSRDPDKVDVQTVAPGVTAAAAPDPAALTAMREKQQRELEEYLATINVKIVQPVPNKDPAENATKKRSLTLAHDDNFEDNVDFSFKNDNQEEKTVHYNGASNPPSITLDLDDPKSIEVALLALNKMGKKNITLPADLTEQERKNISAAFEKLGKQEGFSITAPEGLSAAKASTPESASPANTSTTDVVAVADPSDDLIATSAEATTQQKIALLAAIQQLLEKYNCPPLDIAAPIPDIIRQLKKTGYIQIHPDKGGSHADFQRLGALVDTLSGLGNRDTLTINQSAQASIASASSNAQDPMKLSPAEKAENEQALAALFTMQKVDPTAPYPIDDEEMAEWNSRTDEASDPTAATADGTVTAAQGPGPIGQNAATTKSSFEKLFEGLSNPFELKPKPRD